MWSINFWKIAHITITNNVVPHIILKSLIGANNSNNFWVYGSPMVWKNQPSKMEGQHLATMQLVAHPTNRLGGLVHPGYFHGIFVGAMSTEITGVN